MIGHSLGRMGVWGGKGGVWAYGGAKAAYAEKFFAAHTPISFISFTTIPNILRYFYGMTHLITENTS